jgi:bifunctional non-homologous end joining protein LigD
MRKQLLIPTEHDEVTLTLNGQEIRLTNLQKVFWPHHKITKRDLLQYYVNVSRYLLPHLIDRPMVMKRYPNGVDEEFFFMKRAPTPRPDWVKICSIPHKRGNIIDFVLVQDLPTLLWVVNLGCIDLNPWYGRCDDYDRPDFLHFDLDPGPGADFQRVCDVGMKLRDLLAELRMPAYPKTTGSKGLHIYVPIVREPVQKEVWTVAKDIAQAMEARYPKLVTAEYRIANRPYGRVLVDYNQNAWGRTLASIYSVRPKPLATVSMPVTWDDIETGIQLTDYRLDNVPNLLEKTGDLWKGLLGNQRFDLYALATPSET